MLVFAVFLFWIGKGHTLLLDNQNIKIAGQAYKATHRLNVSINNQEPIDLKKGLRKAAKDMVAGPWHTITVEVIDKDKSVLKTVKKTFTVGMDEMFLLSLPALLADESAWIQPFEPPKRQ